MIEIFFLVLGVTGAIVLASVLAYDLGQRSGGAYRFHRNRPLTLIQFDPAVGELLERAASLIPVAGLSSSGPGLRDDAESRHAFYCSMIAQGWVMPRAEPDPKPGNEVA